MLRRNKRDDSALPMMPPGLVEAIDQFIAAVYGFDERFEKLAGTCWRQVLVPVNERGTVIVYIAALGDNVPASMVAAAAVDTCQKLIDRAGLTDPA